MGSYRDDFDLRLDALRHRQHAEGRQINRFDTVINENAETHLPPSVVYQDVLGFSPTDSDRAGHPGSTSTKDTPFVSVANSVAMNVIEANRINIIDTPAVPPM